MTKSTADIRVATTAAISQKTQVGSPYIRSRRVMSDDMRLFVLITYDYIIGWI